MARGIRWVRRLLWLIACLGCGDGGGASSLVVDVMTINLRHDVDWWEERFPMIADEIVRLEPDLIGLQEVEIAVEQSRILSELIQSRNPSLTYEVHEELKSGLAALGGEGIAVMSRHPIVSRDVQDLEYGRVALFDRIQIADRTVDLYNTHLHHQGGDEVRRPQMEALIDFVDRHDEGHAAFLTGDMNATPDSETIRVAIDAGFTDTFEAVHGTLTSSIGNTSPIRLAKSPGVQRPTRRIDYVFARGPGEGEMRVLDAAVAFDRPNEEGLFPSDHLGVVTALETD